MSSQDRAWFTRHQAVPAGNFLRPVGLVSKIQLLFEYSLGTWKGAMNWVQIVLLVPSAGCIVAWIVWECCCVRAERRGHLASDAMDDGQLHVLSALLADEVRQERAARQTTSQRSHVSITVEPNWEDQQVSAAADGSRSSVPKNQTWI